MEFQSTRPHGARHRIGRDLKMAFCVSIHAPAWGATFGILTLPEVASSFNPRARMGRDVSL